MIKGPSNSDSFIDAANSGNLARMIELFDEGIDINHTNDFGQTALINAVKPSLNDLKEDCGYDKKDSAEIVSWLLDHKAAPEMVENNRYGAIHWAAHYGNREAVDLILKQDPALVNAKGPGGFTPIFLAVISSKPETVKTLITHRADIDHKIIGKNGEEFSLESYAKTIASEEIRTETLDIINSQKSSFAYKVTHKEHSETREGRF